MKESINNLDLANQLGLSVLGQNQVLGSKDESLADIIDTLKSIPHEIESEKTAITVSHKNLKRKKTTTKPSKEEMSTDEESFMNEEPEEINATKKRKKETPQKSKAKKKMTDMNVDVEPTQEEQQKLQDVKVEVIKSFTAFKKDIAKLSSGRDAQSGTEIANSNKETLSALYNLANSVKPHDEESTVLTRKIAQIQSETGKTPYPLAALNSSKYSFTKTCLPGGLRFSQWGSTVGIPLKVNAVDGNYLFGRHSLYDDKTKRAAAIKDYYVFLQDLGEYQLAAQGLVVLFSHAVKEYLAYEGVSNRNTYALKTFISEELKRQGFPEPKQETLTAITNIIQKLTIKNYFQDSYLPFDDTDKRPIKLQTDPGAEENGVKKIWLQKQNSVMSEKQHLHSLPDNALKIDCDADVYDKETGCLLMRYRKKVISDKLIREVKDVVATITPAQMPNVARPTVINDNKKVETGVRIVNKTSIRTMPVGFLGNARAGVRMGYDHIRHKKNWEILQLTSQIVKELEKEYQKAVPIEFHYCKSVMDKVKDFVMPDCDIVSSVQWNFDYPTNTHRDNNHFPGKHFNVLTCFYGKQEKNYTGGETYFPEYNVYIDMQEGDSLVAAFEDLLHCNVELNTQDQDANGSMKDTKNANWHRISLVGFVRGELLSLVQRIAFETSDEEVDFTKQQILDAKNGIIPPRSSKGFKFFFEQLKQKAPIDEEKEQSINNGSVMDMSMMS
ncbi:hypothetical protein A8135_06500 [Legionella jamestowniensis]|uniref:Uncharacterized protein n=1 Tax=Legionella jamestowniensis TaxID=455 RepID=A0ABX2XXG4_9GAMM|nr:hypothetical protein [Legionella jamestowniensis]OCH99333.1 hypothetical protein A8135_06500 [Legionella jamestowniensis]